jgi:hypothetical protein
MVINSTNVEIPPHMALPDPGLQQAQTCVVELVNWYPIMFSW